jgi:hypothetical protein
MLKYPKTRIPDWFVEREWPQLNGGGVVAQVQIDKLLGRWCGEYGRRHAMVRCYGRYSPLTDVPNDPIGRQSPGRCLHTPALRRTDLGTAGDEGSLHRDPRAHLGIARYDRVFVSAHQSLVERNDHLTGEAFSFFQRSEQSGSVSQRDGSSDRNCQFAGCREINNFLEIFCLGV